jgi:hypothetical protein
MTQQPNGALLLSCFSLRLPATNLFLHHLRQQRRLWSNKMRTYKVDDYEDDTQDERYDLGGEG